MDDKYQGSERPDETNFDPEVNLEPGQFKPKNEGINNTDLPDVPKSKRALNNPTHQGEGLSGGGSDPLADL